MLKQRVITAVILAAVALWALYGWSDAWFAMFLLVAVAACAWEWSALGGLSDVIPRGIYTALVTMTAALLMAFDDGANLRLLVLLSVLMWVAIALDLFVRPVLTSTTSLRPGMLLQAAFILVVSVAALFWMRGALSASALVYVIALVAAADIGAYFSGRRFGRRKLAVDISAGKTLEGAYGGLALAGVVALVGTLVLDMQGVSSLSWFFFSLVAAVFSIAGDLYISRAKRARGVKDSGRLLPGHGGVLDRFDGLLAAIPWMAFAVMWAS